MTRKYQDTRLCVEKYLSISNNDSGLKKIANLYDHVDDQVVDFKGKDFVYNEPLVPFVLQNCKNLTLKNFTVDFVTPFFFQGQVKTVCEKDKSLDLEILDECIYNIRGGKLYFKGKESGFQWHGRGSEPAACTRDMTWEQNLVWNMWFDEDGSTPKEEPSYYLLEEYTCEELEPGLVRFYNIADRLPQVGWHLIIKGKKEANRRWPGIFIENCENIRIENVTVYNSSGMALISQRTDGIILENYQVRLREGSKRMCSSTADGSHFSGCKGSIIMNNCYFENMLDDALNTHGIFVLHEEILDEYTVLCRFGHSQQLGVPFADTGDIVRAYKADSFEMIKELKVSKVEIINKLYFKMSFEETVDDLLMSGIVYDNKTWQPEVTVSNCTVKNNRARTLLIQTEKPVVIEDNIFERPSMNCLQFSGDTNFWYESGFVNDVVIKNNIFRDIRDYAITAYIEVDSDIKYHHNIRIYNNDFYGYHSKIFKIYSVNNFEFRNNNLYLSRDSVNEDSYKYDNCSNITIENNKEYDHESKKKT